MDKQDGPIDLSKIRDARKKSGSSQNQDVPMLKDHQVGQPMACRCGCQSFRLFTAAGAGCASCGALYSWEQLAPEPDLPNGA